MAKNKEEIIKELDSLLEHSREIPDGRYVPSGIEHTLQEIQLKLINLLDQLR